MNQTRFHVCLVLAYVRCALVCLKQMAGTRSSSPVAGGAVEGEGERAGEREGLLWFGECKPTEEREASFLFIIYLIFLLSPGTWLMPHQPVNKIRESLRDPSIPLVSHMSHLLFLSLSKNNILKNR